MVAQGGGCGHVMVWGHVRVQVRPWGAECSIVSFRVAVLLCFSSVEAQKVSHTHTHTLSPPVDKGSGHVVPSCACAFAHSQPM